MPGQTLDLTYGNESDGTVAMTLDRIYEGDVLEGIKANSLVVIKDGEQLTQSQSLTYYYLLPFFEYVDPSEPGIITDLLTQYTTFTYEFTDTDSVVVTHNKGKRPLTEVFIAVEQNGQTIYTKSDEPTIHSEDMNSFSMSFPQNFSGFIIYKF